MTKKLLSLLLLLTFLCFASCEEDESVDPSLMPAATTVGANTFGCLIDGWVYTSGRFGLPKVTDESTPDESCLVIVAPVGIFNQSIRLTLQNPVEGTTCACTIESAPDIRETGQAFITRRRGQVLSGTFSGERVTEGRFDLLRTDLDLGEVPVE